MDGAGLQELTLQLFKGMYRRELGELLDHVLRGVEQDARFRLAQHGGVVVGIARSNHLKIQRYLKRGGQQWEDRYFPRSPDAPCHKHGSNVEAP